VNGIPVHPLQFAYSTSFLLFFFLVNIRCSAIRVACFSNGYVLRASQVGACGCRIGLTFLGEMKGLGVGMRRAGGRGGCGADGGGRLVE
jgi:hypothetical protein